MKIPTGFIMDKYVGNHKMHKITPKNIVGDLRNIRCMTSKYATWHFVLQHGSKLTQ